MKVASRLAWKILGAVLLVAVLSVLVSTYALEYTLRRFSAFAVQRQREIGGASTHAADVFRSYFAERKEAFRRRARDLAAARPVDLGALSGEDGLLRVRVLEDGRETAAWSAPAGALAGAREAPPILVAIPVRDGGGPQRQLEVVFGIPAPMYADFLALQAAIERERQLDRAFEAVVPNFLRDYLVLVASVLLIGPVVGLVLARRVTRRLARLQDAARRVGEGDLDVRVAPRGNDELDDLGRAFDRMVGELGQARSRVEYLQKVAAWEEVARRLAHEIKNPLTPVQLAVQQLGSQYRGDDAAYRRLLGTAQEILRDEIGGLRRLVDDFTALARLPKVEPMPQDLADLVAEAVRLQPEWQGLVVVAPPSAPAPVLCDPVLLRRVLANLVENAVQAVRAAGREPAIALAVAARDARVVLTVDDNGPGVAPAERARVFDPYVTNRPDGTGLGLAIVRKIIIDHGGDVGIEDAPPPHGGARVVVELPLRSEAPAARS